MKNNMRVIVLTSDKTMHALPAFAYQFNKYWSPEQKVIIGGFTPPIFDLPSNFSFLSLGAFKDYPVGKWSNALIAFLEQLSDDRILWMMDDFWLVRPVDREAVQMMYDYMTVDTRIARFDLTADRLYASNVYDVVSLGRMDIIACHQPVAYSFSFQAAIWRKELLLKYLLPDEQPWQVEMEGTERMNKDHAVVFGTRQFPVRYLIAIQQGRLTLDGGYQQPRPPLTHADIIELDQLGYLPQEGYTA